MFGNRITFNNGKTTYQVEVAKNQKVVQIHRVKNGINFEANLRAMKTLSANGYVLYMYLMMHEKDRVWALSSKDVYRKTPLTEKTYPKAVQELIDNNYLIKENIGVGGTLISENAYHLYETPHIKQQPTKPIRTTAVGREIRIGAEVF